ncbi:YggT family protein [Candidatus Marinimicrobia bacterium MT.SAG.3]|nr:YggT family protein [Candidatus Marinimicrobia bacterium MT.SAG.3]TFB13819.1 YggT family protein [Candidatus Marinimicrobia bacterium MT.SAG.4]
MVIIGNLLVALGKILNLLISIGYILFLARAVISWVEVDRDNQFVIKLHNLTEPVLDPIRKYMPAGTIDFSPMAVLLMLYFADIFVVESLLDIGFRLK